MLVLQPWAFLLKVLGSCMEALGSSIEALGSCIEASGSCIEALGSWSLDPAVSGIRARDSPHSVSGALDKRWAL